MGIYNLRKRERDFMAAGSDDTWGIIQTLNIFKFLNTAQLIMNTSLT